jgi:8-oxo-dGTP diphosphatase
MMKLATICYIKSSGKTLMLHRIKKENDVHEGKWIGLGGKVEEGESPEDCIIREVEEESGLTIKEPCMKGFLTFPRFKDNEDWYVFVFTANSYEGKLIESREGVIKWVEDKEIFNLNLWEGDKLFLKWMEGNRFFSGKLIYDQGELKHSSVMFY